ncbi:MAG: nitroreductase family protein [Desulfopila sp.]
MNGINDLIERRKSYRALANTPVPEEVLTRIMTAATYAPSCFNSQPWRYLVLTEPDRVQKAHSALSGGNYWAKSAPVIVVLATKQELDARLSDGRDYAFFGCGLSAANLIHQAFAEGLYAHPMAGFEPEVIKEELAVPADFTIINLIAIGYPGKTEHLSEKHQLAERAARSRKPEKEVICYNTWCLG